MEPAALKVREAISDLNVKCSEISNTSGRQWRRNKTCAAICKKISNLFSRLNPQSRNEQIELGFTINDLKKAVNKSRTTALSINSEKKEELEKINVNLLDSLFDLAKHVDPQSKTHEKISSIILDLSALMDENREQK